MFDEETLDKIFSNQYVGQVPLIYQSIMIHAIENIIDGKEEDITSVVKTDCILETIRRG